MARASSFHLPRYRGNGVARGALVCGLSFVAAVAVFGAYRLRHGLRLWGQLARLRREQRRLADDEAADPRFDR
jgi:hypothetical protein